MKKLLDHFRSRLRRQTWISAGCALLVSLAILSLISHSTELGGIFEKAFAEVTATNPTGSGTGSGFFGSLGQGVGTVISGLATLFIKLLAGILWFVLYWMGDLMDNTFILEGQIGEKLRSVWVIVRNFVNIFFAIVLVVAALMNVIGYADEGGNYAMKKFIPKMALALIAVNFTFLACRLVLDLNNVITTAIFAIPRSVTSISDIGPSGTAGVRIFKNFKCLSSQSTLDQEMQRVGNLERQDAYKGVINSLGGVCFAVDPGPNGVNNPVIALDSSQFNKKDFVWTMATQFQGLHNLNKVSQLTNPDFTGLTVNALFSIIFAVIYGAAYVAMFVILLARMVVLWITIMLSPLAAISIAIPDLLPEELNIQKKFLDHAFVPAKMAVPISFGYILISQMNIAIQTDSLIVQDKTLNLSESGEFARETSITSLMYGAASVAIIWMGVFTASKDVIGSEFVNNWIKEPIQKAGSTVAKWPTYLPILPVSGGASLQTVMTGIETYRKTIAEGRRKRDLDIANKYLASLGIITSETRGAVEEIERAIQRGNGTITTTNIGRIRDVAKGNDGEFKRLTQQLAQVTNTTDQRAIAQTYGYGDNFTAFQTDVNNRNWTNLKQKLESAAPPPQTSGGGPMYTDIASGTLALDEAQKNITLSDTAIGDLDQSIRGRFKVSDTDKDFKLQEVEFSSFITNLRDSSKVGPEALRAFLPLLQNVVEKNQNVKQEIGNDTALIQRIRNLRSSDTDNNTVIRKLIASIRGITDENEVTRVTGIKPDGSLNS
ncbi:MAG: hypothetical protein AB7J40_02195 [Candidatus Altimarinota bacterium]